MITVQYRSARRTYVQPRPAFHPRDRHPESPSCRGRLEQPRSRSASSLAYTPDSRWRNRAEFVTGRAEIVAFLTRKWAKELDYRLIKELWAFTDNRIAVRFAYEWHDDSGNWFRSYGNENWEFDAAGLMQRRFACINDLPIPKPSASSTGRWAGGRTTIPA